MRYLAEEFGVGAHAVQFYGVAVDAVDQHLVGLDVAVAVILPVPRKGVITVFFGQPAAMQQMPQDVNQGCAQADFLQVFVKAAAGFNLSHGQMPWPMLPRCQNG